MMQFIFACNMLMHFHALHVSFLFFPVPCLLFWLCLSLISLSLSLSLSHLVSSLWHPKSLFLLKTQFVVVPLHLLFPQILFNFMMRRHVMTWHVMTSLRTFLTKRFIRNTNSFCLISQTLYLVLLALGDGLFYVRNPRGVPTCSYRSFTLICTPWIPLCLDLPRYSVIHIS